MKRFAYLDIEATHNNWHDAQIIEIAFVIKDENGKDLDHFQSLIKPTNEISEQICALTGITQKMLDNAPELHKVAQTIHEKLEGCIIVAHKVEFDYEILKSELSPLNLELNNKKICTLLMSQRLIPELKSYSLKALCSLIHVKIKNHHRALDDVLALYELHTYLRMINEELTVENRYLPEHEKLIKKTPKAPGVIVVKETKETFKSENLNNKLKEILAIKPSNKHRVFKNPKIEIFQTATVLHAGLIKTKFEKPFYPYSIFKIKTKTGKDILIAGKTNLKRKAVYFTKTKKEAIEIIKQVTPRKDKVNLVYQDSDNIKSEITKSNIQLAKNIKKLIALEKNYLVRSTQRVNGKYHYIVIRSSKSFATFEADKLISNSKDLYSKELKFKPMRPREYMSLNHSLKWIKNQKNKTDILIEIKKGH